MARLVQQPTINNQPYPYLKPLRVYGFASPPTLTLSHYLRKPLRVYVST
ncbi:MULTISPECIES: hypothetical protein [Fischerella]|nr:MULTISPECIES: hypothetical protein [Fischerella]MBD2433586.1 hypothetical protein [Fischerella sp. FACHB-380]